MNQDQRPSVDDLLNLPEISIRVREKRLKENINIIKIREEELQRKEQELSTKEINLKKADS